MSGSTPEVAATDISAWGRLALSRGLVRAQHRIWPNAARQSPRHGPSLTGSQGNAHAVRPGSIGHEFLFYLPSEAKEPVTVHERLITRTWPSAASRLAVACHQKEITRQ